MASMSKMILSGLECFFNKIKVKYELNVLFY